MTSAPTPPSAPVLAQCLGAAIGRGTVLGQGAQQQLTGMHGTLTSQLCQLLDRILAEVHGLLGTRADLPSRRPHDWTLLTEFENAAWPILALSQPPALSPLETVRIARHLATAHVAMDQSKYRHWAKKSEPHDTTEALVLELSGEQRPTWGTLLVTLTVLQTQLALLHTWGVLSAYIGLNQDDRIAAARQLGGRLEDPSVILDPAGYAAEAVWAALWPLHGGLSRPDIAQVTDLAQGLRTLPERTVREPLPDLPALNGKLAELLPILPGSARRELSERLHGIWPTDVNLSMTGVRASAIPGQMAYWLRRAGEVQLIVSSAQTTEPTSPLVVQAWRWRLPQRSLTLL